MLAAPLLDDGVLRQMEERRSASLWAQAARGDLSRLSTQHNIYLQKAIQDAGITCHKCRKKAMAQRMVSEAAARDCQASRPKTCLDRVQRAAVRGGVGIKAVPRSSAQ